MTILNGIRAVGDQRVRSRDEAGNLITIDLRYLPGSQAWIADISSQTFTVTGNKLINSLNILWPFQRNVDFGIAVFSNDGVDPFLINDFSVARCRIAILTMAEVEQINSFYSSGVFPA